MHRPAHLPSRLASARWTAWLALLALAGACAAPGERISQRETALLSADGEDVLVRGRFDPFQGTYFVDVLPLGGTLTPLSRETAIEVVEQGFGPIVCAGGPMEVGGGAWGIIAPADEATPYVTRGGWQILADCA